MTNLDGKRIRGRVLIVDDEPDFTRMVMWQLEKRFYEVYGENSGVAAMEFLKTRDVDVLVTDIRMPEMDGIELITRTLAVHPDIQCLVITGHGDVDTAIEAMRAGACNFLKKPAGVDELDMAISRAMEKLTLIRDARIRQAELEESNRELSALRARLEILLDKEKDRRKAAEDALKERIVRETLVETLTLALRLFKQTTGKTKVDFAEESKIWTASVDGNGTYRTRTLDKYLKRAGLPPNPRHSDVLDSAYFVLSHCPLDQDMKESLELKVRELEKLTG